MEKVWGLLDTAIAAFLVVIALSVQLYENYRLTEILKAKEAAAVVKEDAHLRDWCDGLELAIRLSVLAEKQDEIICFAGREYTWQEFSTEVLGVHAVPDASRFLASRQQQEQLQKRHFQIYQLDGKWRIEE